MHDEQMKQILEKTDYIIKQRVETAAEIEKKTYEKAKYTTDEEVKDAIMNGEDLSAIFKKGPENNVYLKMHNICFIL